VCQLNLAVYEMSQRQYCRSCIEGKGKEEKRKSKERTRKKVRKNEEHIRKSGEHQMVCPDIMEVIGLSTGSRWRLASSEG
jgi:hypothetical protein